jgi:hypothetical protein
MTKIITGDSFAYDRHEQILVALFVLQFRFGFRQCIIKIPITPIIFSGYDNGVPTILLKNRVRIHRDPVCPGLMMIQRFLSADGNLTPSLRISNCMHANHLTLSILNTLDASRTESSAHVESKLTVRE